MKELLFKNLVDQLENDHATMVNTRLGLCRRWSQCAILVIKNFREANNLDFRIEVREVEVESFLYHTFIRILTQEEIFILDGVGTAKHASYFGLESDAEHLKNSKLDPMQYYHLSDE